jgi:hypothetical protein
MLGAVRRKLLLQGKGQTILVRLHPLNDVRAL